MLIELKSLCREFTHKDGQKYLAVNNLNLSIEKGEVFGILGPNGAGKTTTIRMLTGLLKPSGGQILYNGRDFAGHLQEIKSMIGIVPQHLNFDQDLTVWENLELHGRLHHMPQTERHSRIDELLDYVELGKYKNDSVKKLSGGMKRRLLIVRALMHNPQILFFDEPTVALDPQVRRRIWDLIRTLPKHGITVLLTTHYIEEAESLCSRVAILNKGSLIKLGAPEALCRELGRWVTEWDGEHGRSYKIFEERETAIAFAAGINRETLVRRLNLEDVFMELTGGKIK